MKYCFFLVFILLFYSCNCKSAQNRVFVETYDEHIKIIDSPKKPLELLEKQPFLAFGKIEQVSFPDSMKAERNLIAQMSVYKSAFFHGDVLTCGKYIYPDAIKYCKQYYRGLSDEEALQKLMKDVSGSFLEIMSVCESRGIEVSLVNPNLLRKVKCGNDIIIVFNTTINICSEYVYTYSKEMSRDIGVSQNNGENWLFFAENEDTPAILGMHYSQEIVNKVMNY